MYPPSNKTWNTNMLVVQTAAEPPNHGRMHLLTISCIWKSKNALRNEVDAKSNLVVPGTSRPWLSRADFWNVAVPELKPAPLATGPLDEQAGHQDWTSVYAAR
jgi:hypothetical protein